MQDTQEIWKEVSGYGSKYAVSNLGRMKNQKTGRILKPYYDWRNYVRMTLSLGAKGKFEKIYLHRLILISFNIPNPENKPQVNHKNGIPSDNRLSNLEWCTSLENIRHARRNGLFVSGLLNETLVKEIRSKYIPGRSGSIAKICKEYKLKAGHVQKIVYREIWAYV